MKKNADKNRSFREFSVGDMVFLKLQPYIQASVAPRANHKLLFKYYGPFRVLAKISNTAYRLQLPEGSTVHPVFHVSLLRQALSRGTPVSHQLPHSTDGIAIPVKVLDRRWRKKANQTVEQVLIQWNSGDSAAATWEDHEELYTRFPLAPAWGQAVSKGRGVSGTVQEAHPTWSSDMSQAVNSSRPTKEIRVHPEDRAGPSRLTSSTSAQPGVTEEYKQGENTGKGIQLDHGESALCSHLSFSVSVFLIPFFRTRIRICIHIL